MMKIFVVASVLSLAFGASALAQATVAPAGEAPVTAEPYGSGALGMPHARHYSHHAQRRHPVRHHAPASAPAGTTQP